MRACIVWSSLAVVLLSGCPLAELDCNVNALAMGVQIIDPNWPTPPGFMLVVSDEHRELSYERCCSDPASPSEFWDEAATGTAILSYSRPFQDAAVMLSVVALDEQQQVGELLAETAVELNTVAWELVRNADGSPACEDPAGHMEHEALVAVELPSSAR